MHLRPTASVTEEEKFSYIVRHSGFGRGRSAEGGRKRSMSDQKGAKVLSQAGLLDLILGPICLRKQLVATSVISLELRAGSRGGKKSEKGGSRGGAISPLKTHYLFSSRDTF